MCTCMISSVYIYSYNTQFRKNIFKDTHIEVVSRIMGSSILNWTGFFPFLDNFCVYLGIPM